MNSRDFFKRAGFNAIIVALTGVMAFAWPTNSLQNGTFSEGSDGLDYWTARGVYVLDGNAVFLEDDPCLTLSQEFTIPDFAQKLSFEIQFLSGEYPETDVFTASLLDPDGNSLTGEPNFFHWDSDTGDPSFADTIVLDIGSDLWGKNALLSFDLQCDGLEPLTEVRLDNVSILIPAPGALMLGLVGTGLVGVIRKLRAGKLI